MGDNVSFLEEEEGKFEELEMWRELQEIETWMSLSLKLVRFIRIFH